MNMMKKDDILKKIHKKLIVSCQALESEPLYSSMIMGRMALAAELGGAAGIRANTVIDITEIKKTVPLPVIGIIKKQYGDNSVYITPTMAEVDALIECGCEIIAVDATLRTRPDGADIDTFFREIREKYPDQLFMADISTYEEGIHAWQLGFDIVATTLRGYTDESEACELPDYNLIRQLSEHVSVPVIAEGGIHYPEQLKAVFDAGAYAAVVGGAITRPMEITKRFVEVL